MYSIYETCRAFIVALSGPSNKTHGLHRQALHLDMDSATPHQRGFSRPILRVLLNYPPQGSNYLEHSPAP